ncbi:MAG: nuclear transport factor 2 family protein [Pseudomonadota bacterium]|nr:nuclear transport factor 2 family protein [Pseudomonadota bacterium]
MKKSTPCVFLAALLASTFVQAQSLPPGWDTEIRQIDRTYWDAYNQCDIKKMAQMNADGLEFYHDKGGAMLGKQKFTAAMEKNICGNPSNRVRREAIDDSVQVFPLLDGGKLYGAVIEGNHRFYNREPGAPEVLSDRARFNHLLLLKDGAWKVARVLSYAHTPIRSEKMLAEVQVGAASLERLAGTYKAKDKMVLTVKAAGNHLMVEAGGRTFELYPTSVNNFAMKERDIKVAFAVDAAGKGQGLVVRERGAIVAEASAPVSTQ